MRFLGLKNMESHHTLYLQKKKQCASIKALIENRLNIPPMISTNTRQKAPFSFLVQFPSKMLNCFLLELQGVMIKFQMDSLYWDTMLHGYLVTAYVTAFPQFVTACFCAAGMDVIMKVPSFCQISKN